MATYVLQIQLSQKYLLQFWKIDLQLFLLNSKGKTDEN